MTASADLFVHLASWGLVGGPTQPIDIGNDHGVLARIEFERLTGVALRAVESGAVVGDSAWIVEGLRDRHVRLLQQTLLAEAVLVRISAVLSGSEIEHRVLKGCATAHLDYDDPTERVTSDVDLLVRHHDFDRATNAVASIVDRDLTVPDRRRSWTTRFGKDRTLAIDGGGWLDLHQRLVPGYYGLVDDFDWFRSREDFIVGEAGLSAFSLEGRFVHALAHAGYTEHLRFHSARDVPVLLGRLESQWRSAVDRHGTLAPLLARGVERTWRAFELEHHPILDWADGVRLGWRQRLVDRGFDLPGSRQHWTSLAALPVRHWPRLIVPLVLPSSDYLDHYGRSRFDHVRGPWAALRERTTRRGG